MPTPDPNAQIYAEICKIMNVDWDPIGGCPEDEYYGYSARVYAKLKSGTSIRELTQYLDGVVKDRMGLVPDTDRSSDAANKIFALSERLV